MKLPWLIAMALLGGFVLWIARSPGPAADSRGPSERAPARARSSDAVLPELERSDPGLGGRRGPEDGRTPVPLAAESRVVASALPPLTDVTSGAASVLAGEKTEEELFGRKYASLGPDERAVARLGIEARMQAGEAGNAQALTPEQAAWLRREAAWLVRHPGR